MEKERNSNNYLTPADIENFKAMLLEKREEILGNVTTMEYEALKRERSDLSNMPIHMADIGSDNYEIENTLGLLDSERKLLDQINDALERIEEGTYGICQGSGKPIPKARLEAIPWAKYCVEYANMLEKSLVGNDFYSTYTNYDYGEDEQDEDPEKPFKRKAV